jgi:putative transposase
MRKSINPLTPGQVYRYAVQAFQPHLKFRDAKNVAAETVLTVLFAAAARISSLSDTCRRLRNVPDEHIVAEALYSTLPDDNRLRQRVQAALRGCLPKTLRRRPQVVAIDSTLLPYYGADRRTNPLVVRSKAKKGTCSFFGYGTAYVVRKGQRYTVALTAVIRSMTTADVVRELLKQVRAAGIKIRYLVLDREFYSVEVIRYLQSARTPFLMPVVGHGRKADHPLGPSGSNVFKECKTSGWCEYTLCDAKGNKATVNICVKCRNLRGERDKKGREALVYAYWKIKIARKGFDWVKEAYRSRFGIETS